MWLELTLVDFTYKPGGDRGFFLEGEREKLPKIYEGPRAGKSVFNMDHVAMVRQETMKDIDGEEHKVSVVAGVLVCETIDFIKYIVLVCETIDEIKYMLENNGSLEGYT